MRRQTGKLSKSIGLLALASIMTIGVITYSEPRVTSPYAYGSEMNGTGNTSEDSLTDSNDSSNNLLDLSDYAAGKDTDVVLSAVNAPEAKYSTGTTVGFTATVKGNGAYILSIAPVVSADFPFETNDAAYKIITPNENEHPNAINASYNFTVRSDVATGYHSVQFLIEYNKDGTNYNIVKTINIKLEGAPEPTEATTEAATEATGPISTPRVIVTGFETSPAKVNAGENFTLTLHLKNTSNRTAVSNMKVSMTAADGEFLPTSGSSTSFIQKLGKDETTDIVMEMTARSNLEPKPYVLAVACDYEDASANPFQSSENISIPVYQESRIKITEISVTPDMISVYNQGSVSFNINNLGKSTIANVQARLEGDSIECEDTFVGNIAAGATGYADVTVTGVAPTMDDGTVKLVLTYEDSSGEECTFESEATVFVMEEMIDYSDDNFYIDDEMPEQGSPVKKILIILIIVLVVIIGIIVAIILIVKAKKKKKARLEAEELENEIEEDLLSDGSKENQI